MPGNAVAHANSRLLKAYGDKAPAFRALVLVVKSWAKSRGLNDASEGYLSSYAHALTCLHFCLVKRACGRGIFMMLQLIWWRI